jgi:hypothetical protein
MRRIGSVFAAFGLLLVAACAPKPELISAEQIARPHVASIIETEPKVILDPGRPVANVMPGVMVAPLPILAVGLLVAGAAQGIENARADARRNRALALEEQLGPTGQIGADLNRQLREALSAEIRAGTRMPILRVETAAGPDGALTRHEEPRLLVLFSSLLTQDLRSVNVQARVTQRSWRPGERQPDVVSYDLLAFSAPIEASTDEEALALWRENNYARLRQATRALVPEVMGLLRMAVLDAQSIDIASLPRASAKLSGFSMVRATGSAARPVFLRYQSNVSGAVLKRTPERDFMILQTLQENQNDKPSLIWLSLPAGSL